MHSKKQADHNFILFVENSYQCLYAVQRIIRLAVIYSLSIMIYLSNVYPT